MKLCSFLRWMNGGECITVDSPIKLLVSATLTTNVTQPTVTSSRPGADEKIHGGVNARRVLSTKRQHQPCYPPVRRPARYCKSR